MHESEARTARTLVEVLLRRAEQDPTRVAFTFLAYKEPTDTNTTDLTYVDLLARSTAIAERLEEVCSAGNRVLILCAPGPAYTCAFFGCQLAGMVAVPAYPPRNAKHMGRLETIRSDCGAAVILTEAILSARIGLWLKDMLGNAAHVPPIVAVDSIEWSHPVPQGHCPAGPDDLSFLQYTSGTTGLPKGVMVTHRALLANLSALETTLPVGREDKGVSWLPPYHDMGLIGTMLLPVFVGVPCWHMAPQAFLQRPQRWLEAIGRFGVTITSAPDFAWKLCADTIDEGAIPSLDLSSLRIALSGAEVVRASTLNAFAAKFGPAGFRRECFMPAYGMAETVVITTGAPPGFVRARLASRRVREAGSQVVALDTGSAPAIDSSVLQGESIVVSCGPVIDGHHLKIVEPQTHRECRSGDVGEIWIAGPSVAGGYFGKPEASEEVFGGRLADDPASGPWLRTGDLGAVVDDEIFVLGRIKEMVIVRGRNHYAQDLEATAAESHPILAPHRTAAFGIDDAGEEVVVLVLEVPRSATRRIDPEDVFTAIRRAILEAHEIDVAAIVLVKPGGLPRTTSGKLQRGKARQQFRTGQLAEVAAWRRDSAPAVSVEPSDKHPTRLPDSAAVVDAVSNFSDVAVADAHYRLDEGGEARLDIFIVAESEDPSAAVPRPSATEAKGPNDGRLRFGLYFFGSDTSTPGEGARYNLLLEAAERADAAGLESVWTPERHFGVFGGQYPNPVVTSAAVAARTRSLSIRAGSVVLPLHHPVRVAEDWSMIDNISGGRVGVSFASGWHARDFVLMPGAHPDRKQRMLDAIDTVRRLWRGEEVELSNGEETHSIRIRPLPVQDEIPIWITAAGSEETFVAAGQRGYNVLTFLAQSSPDAIGQKLRSYRDAYHESGHGGRPIASVMVHAFLAGTTSDAQGIARGPLRSYVAQATDLAKTSGLRSGDSQIRLDGAQDALIDNAVRQFMDTRGLIGSPKDCLQRVAEWQALGFDEIACLLDFGLPDERVLEHLDYIFELDELCRKSARSPKRTLPDRATSSRFEAAVETVFPVLAGRTNVHVVTRLPRMVADQVIQWLQTYARDNINSFEIDERRTIPPSLVLDFAREGLFGLRVPAELGGLGLSVRDTSRVLEQVAAIDPTLSLLLGIHNGLGLSTLMAGAKDALLRRLVPELASGRGLAAFALSEPAAGSNPRAIQTIARRQGQGRWLLSGEKSWIGLGGWARAVIVFCRLHDEQNSFLGFGAFVVESGTPGFRSGPEALTVGVRGIVQNTLYFDDVPVSDAAMVGAPSRGLELAMRTLQLGRLGLAAVSLGGMKRCAQLMGRYAQRRQISTGSLIDNAVTRERLERLIVRISAVEALLGLAADTLDRGETLPDDLYSVAKMSAPEYFWNAADQLVQTLGGRGYEEPNEAPRLLRDARLFRIFEGPTETVGVYLGIRLRSNQSDLPTYLTGVLSADDLVARMDRCRDLCSAASSVSAGNEAVAFALAEMATTATMLAAVRQRHAAGSEVSVVHQAEAVFGTELDAAEARIGDLVVREPSTASWVGAAIARFAKDIGNIDRDVPDSHRGTDSQLLPDSADRQHTRRPRKPAFVRAVDDEAVKPPPEADPAIAANLRLLRDLIAETMKLPAETIKPDTPLDGLGLNSLHAIHLAARIGDETGQEIELSRLFEAPTLAALAASLATEPATPSRVIPQVDRTSGELPLSFQQERLWFLDRIDKAAGLAYNEVRAFRLSGPLNTEALATALGDVIARHESLRTRFEVVDGTPVQVVDKSPASADTNQNHADQFVFEDVGELDSARLVERVAELLNAPFDLAAGPLFRARLLRLSDEEHILVCGGHHIVRDGWSDAIVARELSELYRKYATGRPVTLPENSLQYADYAAWQRASWAGERLGAEMYWWRETLSGIPEAITLPFDRPRPAVMDYQGRSVAVAISQDVISGLEALARSEGATLFTGLDAAFAALMYRIGGDEDIVVGTAVAGRVRPELEDLVGMFVNTVALRHRIQPDQSFREHLRATRRAVVSAFDHQQAPFESVVEAVAPTRSMGHPPVAQVMVVLQNTADISAAFALDDVAVTPFDVEIPTAKCELTLDVRQTGEGLVGTLTYATQLFDESTAKRLVGMFQQLLKAAVERPETLVADLPILSDTERDKLLRDSSGESIEAPCGKTVADLFVERARATPDALAVVDGSRALSYRELDTISNRIARHLIGLGVGAESIVGVCMERSAEAISVLLGILKAGSAYLPLDPDYPRERLSFMMEDAGAAVVVTTTEAKDSLPSIGDPTNAGTGRIELVLLDGAESSAAIAAESSGEIGVDELNGSLGSDTLAYVVYTSGSTGRPKGVMIEHGQLTQYTAFAETEFALSARETVLHRTTLGFDYAAEELWWPLAHGHSIVVAREESVDDPATLLKLVEQQRVTTMVVVPSLLATLAANSALADLTDLRQILCGGEALPPTVMHSVLEQRPDLRLINHYGPTEATINATFHICDLSRGEDATVSIGRPVADTQIYIVDKRLRLQPPGITGELLIGGRQVGRGYLGRPGLTAERFIADPFSSFPGARLYRTGDLARWRSDGTIEYLGRIDHQVKIRGIRVELGEIETALMRCAGIRQATVVAGPGADGILSLIAYLVPVDAPTTSHNADGGKEPAIEILALEQYFDLETIRASLKRSLPGHMVPSAFVGISQLPQTASGKVDRKALPEADVSMVRAPYTPPETATEKTVAAVFAELLNVTRVGVADNFFDLGGHSLLAISLVARLGAETGTALPVRTIFEAPTVAALAMAIARSENQVYEPLLRFTSEQSATRARIYCFHDVTGHATPFANLVDPLSRVAEVVGIQAPDLIAGHPTFATYADLIDTYTKALLGEPVGCPSILLGWSVGASIAHDVACRLTAKGRPIAGIVILDRIDGTNEIDLAMRNSLYQWSEDYLHIDLVSKLDPGPSQVFDGKQISQLADVLVDAGIVDRQRIPNDQMTLRYLLRSVVQILELIRDRPPSGFFPGCALVVRAMETSQYGIDPALGWDTSCQTIDTLEVPFKHSELLQSKNAAMIAREISLWLLKRLKNNSRQN